MNKFKKFVKDHKTELVVLTTAVVAAYLTDALAKRCYAVQAVQLFTKTDGSGTVVLIHDFMDKATEVFVPKI